ncbi:MAG: hypothetical protein JWN61_578 [Pseudonocardiales bacterium]|nr:hypothetical protein [Pseudonocardiales bacterium]
MPVDAPASNAPVSNAPVSNAQMADAQAPEDASPQLPPGVTWSAAQLDAAPQRDLSFAEILALPGVVETVRLGGPVGIMAFHGGTLERTTDLIAHALAERCDVSLYVVAQPEGTRAHVPSHLVRREDSPKLDAFLDHVEVAIALHGYGRMGRRNTLLAGGTNREFAATVARHLREHLDDYTVIDDLQDIPPELRGLHADNPVNLPIRGGVQLELPPRVRGRGPFWPDEGAPGLRAHSELLVQGLLAAIAAWPRASDDAEGPAEVKLPAAENLPK